MSVAQSYRETRQTSLAPMPDQTVDDQPLGVLDALGDAVVLSCADVRCIQARTSAFARLPGLGKFAVGDAWSSMLCHLEQLHQGGRSYRFNRRLLSDGRVLIRVDVQALDTQQYLSERDSLFLTSRTVSVSEMATALAHELNQPLGTLSNLLQGARLRQERGQWRADMLEPVLVGALEQTQYAQSVIARIRDFTASRRPEPKSLSLRDLMDRTGSLLDWLLLASSVTLQVTHHKADLCVLGDETMLQQVLINLIRNAVDAMRDCDPAQRVIDVTIDEDGSMATLSIHDRGSGLAADAEAPFLPFVSGKPDGMGVGLNICRSFLELHQGRLWLEPNTEGGCTARIELPMAPVARVGTDRKAQQGGQ